MTLVGSHHFLRGPHVEQIAVVNEDYLMEERGRPNPVP